MNGRFDHLLVGLGDVVRENSLVYQVWNGEKLEDIAAEIRSDTYSSEDSSFGSIFIPAPPDEELYIVRKYLDERVRVWLDPFRTKVESISAEGLTAEMFRARLNEQAKEIARTLDDRSIGNISGAMAILPENCTQRDQLAISQDEYQRISEIAGPDCMMIASPDVENPSEFGPALISESVPPGHFIGLNKDAGFCTVSEVVWDDLELVLNTWSWSIKVLASVSVYDVYKVAVSKYTPAGKENDKGAVE